MQPAGLKALDERDREKSGRYSYEERSRGLERPYEEQLRGNEAAWRFFQAQAPSYQRTVSFWVMSAKREETRLRRLAVLIEGAAAGRRLNLLSPGAGQDKTRNEREA